MINVSHKTQSLRYAKAEGLLKAGPDVRQRLREKSIPKGDVEATARAAGIDAAKRTSEWVTFCQTLPLDWVDLDFEVIGSIPNNPEMVQVLLHGSTPLVPVGADCSAGGGPTGVLTATSLAPKVESNTQVLPAQRVRTFPGVFDTAHGGHGHG